MSEVAQNRGFWWKSRTKKRETKKGQSPSSSVLDMVNMIFYIKMKIKEISAEKTYIIVDLGARNFILTLRLAY